MGTRADFYVGRGESAEWLGSIAFDGYPDGLVKTSILQASTEAAFREAVKQEISTRDDGTKPEDGWPWPWQDSRTTDFAYAFDGGKVLSSCFGHEWEDPLAPEPEGDDGTGELRGPKTAVFPDMSARENVAAPGRSVPECWRSPPPSSCTRRVRAPPRVPASLPGKSGQGLTAQKYPQP